MENNTNAPLEFAEPHSQLLGRTERRASIKPLKNPTTALRDLELLSTIFEHLAEGIAVVSAEGRLIFANAEAKRTIAILYSKCKLGGDFCADDAESKTLKKALTQAAFKKKRSLLEIKVSNEPIQVLLSPLLMTNRGLVLVTFGTPITMALASLKAFADLYRLTSAELNVLEKFARGVKPARIAALQCVALSTINTQLASIRAKTQTSSALELMAKLIKIPVTKSIGGDEISFNIRG
jgi:DNA-binding CsgD family transcriptional regulator